MTLWKVHKFYGKDDIIYYEVLPYTFIGYIKTTWKMYGWKMFKNVFLSEKGARKRADKLNDGCGDTNEK